MGNGSESCASRMLLCPEDGRLADVPGSRLRGTSRSEPFPGVFCRSVFETRCRPTIFAFSSSGSPSRSTADGVSAPLPDEFEFFAAVAVSPPIACGPGRRGDGASGFTNDTAGEPLRCAGVEPLGGIFGMGGVPAYCARSACRFGVPIGVVYEEDMPSVGSAGANLGLLMATGWDGEVMVG